MGGSGARAPLLGFCSRTILMTVHIITSLRHCCRGTGSLSIIGGLCGFVRAVGCSCFVDGDALFAPDCGLCIGAS